jgi:glycosyltransferase involved in cell wall biosynthesis
LTIHLDDAIFKLQSHGGISTLWNKLTPHLQALLSEATWDATTPDYFMSTYYDLPKGDVRSIAFCYDFIAEHYPPIGRFHSDAIQKHKAIAHASAVIGISEWTANDAKQVTDKPVFVAHCGTDMQRATPSQVAAFRERHSLSKPYVLVVGRRHLYKNINALYQAWRFFEGRDLCQVMCIGGEPPTIADTSFASDWIQLRLNDSELAAAYTGATMLVYPSLFEGFGLPVLEAMACGTPVICGQRSAIPEFAQDTPYYADVFRPLSVAEQMNAALHPDYERQAKAMQIAREYTWERMANQIVQAIKDIPTDE